MTTQYPLGELRHMRIWMDSTGLGDSISWYLMSVQVMDVQTGVITHKKWEIFCTFFVHFKSYKNLIFKCTRWSQTTLRALKFEQ